ncbi:MAG: hypothetical protein IJ027_06610 [Oscillospiraceae bacterium]|nr:hypothetical protein [Oscillospiraceae bacterium]
MQTILSALRSILGEPAFYDAGTGYSGSWDYGLMIEYLVGALILMIVISSVFRFLMLLVKGKR